MADYPSNPSTTDREQNMGSSTSDRDRFASDLRNQGVADSSAGFESGESRRPLSRQERAMCLDEALRNLNEALASGLHLEDLFTKDFGFLKDAILRLRPTLVNAVRQTGSETRDFLRRQSDTALNRGRDVMQDAKREFDKNPWAIVRGVAFGAVIVGFIVGAIATSGSRKLTSRPMEEYY